MGKGVALNERTFKQGGNAEWVVEKDGRRFCFAGDSACISVQLREHDKPVHYAKIKWHQDPYSELVARWVQNRNLPPLPNEVDFKRAWKKQVKRRFLLNGWQRK